jgi:DHA1 family bicyclomycin/chloramphenicol resistance-like MFS transporter
MTALAPPHPRAGPDLGFREFVALIAALMGANALAIDIMLPALPAIGDAVGIPIENDRQWIITAFMLGFGLGQILYGPLSDRFGRKPILLIGLAIYTAFGALATFAGSFDALIIARIGQGLGAGATRVLAVSIVRDRFAGRQMARVMSLVFIVFLAIPIVAPSIGQGILFIAPWRWIFGLLAVFGGFLMIWAALRMPETLHPEDQRPFSLPAILSAFRVTLTTRQSVGYMMSMSIAFGALLGFINSAQQVFAGPLQAMDLFPLIFALTACALGIASLINSRIVERLGMRVVSHTALLGYIFFAGVHAAVSWMGYENLWTFTVLQSGMMFCFGLMGSNFGALAMEPMGHIAGSASSVQGFCSTTGAALVGFFIGQQFDGTTVPLTLGYLGGGLAVLAVVTITEKGRILRPSR